MAICASCEDYGMPMGCPMCNRIGSPPKKRRDVPTWHELPPQPDIEVPLLEAIEKRGGRVDISIRKDGILDELAVRLSLTPEQRTFTTNDSRENLWYNWVRQVRRGLVAGGYLDNSMDEIWQITDKGRRRLEKERGKERTEPT
jgi:hypothetical protein